MNRKIPGLVVPVTIGLTVVITSCSSSLSGTTAGTATRSAAASSAAASSAPVKRSAAVPAGYHRAGGAAQGISIAVPASWVAINLATETMQQAARRADFKGISGSTILKGLESLQKQHALAVFDVKYAIQSPSHFAINLSAFCGVSGVTDSGSAGVSFLRQAAAAELQQTSATRITQKDISVGGVPGVETSYQLTSSTVGTVQGAQIEVLPKPDKACYITLTATKSYFPGQVLTVAAATARFS